MFRVTLNISQESGHAPVNRNRRRKCQLLLVTVSLFSVIGLFLLSCSGREPFLLNVGFNETTNGTCVSNRASKILGRMGTSNDSLKGKAASNFCNIKDCNMIRCSSIPAQLDPGEVASEFFESDFKIDCGTIKSINLQFENCKFPSNIIRKNWLQTDLMIENLILSNCFLTDIEDDAFLPAHFSEMKGLTIISNNIHSLRKAVFKNLRNLRFLTIRDNMVQYVDFDLMANQARTLENLELEGVFGDSKGLENIISGTTLTELQLLSLRRNFLPEVGEDLFSGVSKVKSLFLDGSEITHVHPKAFEPMSKSIIMLIISDNSLTSLLEGLFDSIVNWNSNFRVSIENNPFHCDCSLKWLQDFIRHYPLIVRTIPKCSSPKPYQGLLLTRAPFCQDNTSNTVTPPTDRITIPNTTQSTTTAKTVHILCNSFQSILMEPLKSRRLLWSADFELARRYPGFAVLETEQGGVLVKLPNITKDLALVWFESDAPDDTLNCEKNVRTSFLLRNTKHDTSYTVCLLQKNENSISPLNCLAISTNSDYDSSVWLTNADKSTVFYSTFACLFILCPCIAALTFIIVRRHPSLLKGSKRVMLVKRRNVDAIVLPKGVTMQSESKKKIDREYSVSSIQDDGYVIPLPPSPLPLPPRGSLENLLNKESGVSDWNSQSDGHTYVSGVEPTIPQMVSWKLKRLKSRIEQNKPPLPPREVPSISSGIRSKENIYSENLFYSV